MYKIAVLGDYDSIFGFATLGLDTFPVYEGHDAKARLKKLSEEGYGIVYMTESLAAKIPEVIDEYRYLMTPAIILIPGITGNTGEGVKSVKLSVEKAVGSDILFGNE